MTKSFQSSLNRSRYGTKLEGIIPKEVFMSSWKFTLGFAVILSACNGYKQAPLPAAATVPAGQHKEEVHNSTLCPNWNGTFTSSAASTKILKTIFDNYGNLIISDNGDQWLINGKPQYLPGNKNQTYVGWCALNNSTDQKKGIFISVFEGDAPLLSPSYVDNSTSPNQAALIFTLTQNGVVRLSNPYLAR
jgi:hypothetical protein